MKRGITIETGAYFFAVSFPNMMRPGINVNYVTALSRSYSFMSYTVQGQSGMHHVCLSCLYSRTHKMMQNLSFWKLD